jgi:hypothetical protein
MLEMSCGDGETQSASGIDLPRKQDETMLFQITGVKKGVQCLTRPYIARILKVLSGRALALISQ